MRTILVRADITKPFVVTTGVLNQAQLDGSDRGIGYFSKKLKPTEIRYSVTDKEALAVVFICRNFQHYMWGVKFTIVTDH